MLFARAKWSGDVHKGDTLGAEISVKYDEGPAGSYYDLLQFTACVSATGAGGYSGELPLVDLAGGPVERHLEPGGVLQYTFAVQIGEFPGPIRQWLAANPDVEKMGLSLRYGYSYHPGDGTQSSSSYYSGTSYDAHLLRSDYAPLITNFSLERCTAGLKDDEGTGVLTSLGLAVSEYAVVEGMTLKLYYAQNAEPELTSECIDLTEHIGALLGGAAIDNAQLVTQSFSNSSEWRFMLAFGDAYEKSVAYDSVARAFANLHLSGKSTGGVAFGMFSSSREGGPKLECVYPIYAYGGIEGVTNYSTEEVATGGRWIDGKPVYARTLEIPLTATSGNSSEAIPEIDTLISLDGMVRRNSSKWMPLDFWYSSSNRSNVHLDDSKRVMVNTSELGTAYVHLRYTKTTDAAT